MGIIALGGLFIEGMKRKEAVVMERGCFYWKFNWWESDSRV